MDFIIFMVLLVLCFACLGMHSFFFSVIGFFLACIIGMMSNRFFE